ncbi:MAG: hypothetical protein FGM42_08035 [Ilumatobacteraceae bacterium]|nr:hypothetical protein [Ilumatobacteraceae bacterium]
MFGRKRKQPRQRVVHTPECVAIHEAMLMSLYLGYGAPSTPLFVPSGGLTCTCDQDRGKHEPTVPLKDVERDTNLRSALIAV